MKLFIIILLTCAFRITCAQKTRLYTPAIEPCECQVKIDSSFKTQCAYLIVPENRNKLNSKLIKLPFIVVESKNPAKRKDPVLFTSGGPGNSSLGWATGITRSTIINDRDCIAFEQRGTKYALPYLRLFELDTAIKESYRKNLSKDSMVVEGVKRYKKKLQEKGIDLSGYNSDETVADIHDLLKTLRIDSVNLFGGSYSGGLMLAVLQKDPERIRSLVLDSPLPMFVAIDEDEPANFMEALHVLSLHCEKDSADKELYGSLEEKFTQYFTSITGKIFYMPYVERGTVDTLRVQYTKNELLDVIVNSMLDFTKIKDVPFIITEMIKGKHGIYIKSKLDDIFNKNQAPDGMRISVYCADQSAYNNEDVMRQLYKTYPFLDGYRINNVYKLMCDAWQVPPIKPTTKQPFYSNKPLLSADGEMDPACRPLYMDLIHHYMPNSQRLLFINRSHGVGGKGFYDITQQFLDNPYKRIQSANKDIIAY
jgi:pimeloyl-ACP methyl ester carboxylesterase